MTPLILAATGAQEHGTIAPLGAIVAGSDSITRHPHRTIEPHDVAFAGGSPRPSGGVCTGHGVHKPRRSRERQPGLGDQAIEHVPAVKDAVVDHEVARPSCGLKAAVEAHRVITEEFVGAKNAGFKTLQQSSVRRVGAATIIAMDEETNSRLIRGSSSPRRRFLRSCWCDQSEREEECFHAHLNLRRTGDKVFRLLRPTPHHSTSDARRRERPARDYAGT